MDEFPVVHIPTDEVLEEEEFERLYSASTEIIVLLSVFYIGISIVAVIGNTLVIWVVATTRQMRTVTNMYIANLAFADVVIGLFCIPFQFQAALLQRWNLPWFMCGFCPFIQTVSVNVSVFTLTAIAIDRHRAIINPLRARPTKFISKVIISGIWLFALTFAIPCAIAFRVELVHERFKENDVIFNVTRPFCLNQNLSEAQLATYRYALVFVQYLVPFCVISFVYIQMAVKLWGTRAPGNAQDSRDITLLKNKKKVIKMLIIVVIVFGLCWLPLQLYNILYVTIPEINEYHFISIVWFCCDWLAMSNSCYNPFIYGIYNEKFKREFNKRFAVCFCKFKTSLDTQERTVSMHTRASSIRSTYANSSMRIRNNIFGNGKPRINTINTHFVNNNSSYASTQNPMQNVVNFRQKLAKNNQPTSAYQGMNYDNCSSNGTFGFGTSITRNSDAPFELYQWRRNNFRPMQSDVIEQEADDDTMLTLIELHSTSPQPGGDEQNAAQQEEQTLSLPHSDSSCICQQELGSSTECDGTCILNEVSRVQVPSEKSVTPPTTTTTPTTEGVDAIEDAPVHAPLLWQSTNYYVQATEAAATPTTTTAVNNNSFKLDFNYSESTRDTETMKHYAAAPTTDFNGTAGVAKSAMDVVAVVAANGGQCLTSQT